MHIKHNNKLEPKVIWLTGLSGSGKSTIANELRKELEKLENKVDLIDGDNLRKDISADLSYTLSDRSKNINRAADIAYASLKKDLMVLVTLISPTRKDRDLAKDLIGLSNFIEVYINTPLSICKKRDPKKLYEKIDQGLISNMVGVDIAYEQPLDPNITIDTSVESLESSVSRIISYLYKANSKKVK
jgi:adenylyl-sulfate kinase